MGRPRLKDVAEKSGFTINTVSRAMNGKHDINSHTKSKILKVANELGYRPNKLARSLRLKRTKIIGVIVTDISNPFYSSIIKYTEDACKQRHYNIILRDTDEKIENEEEAIELLAAEQVDGIILAPVQTSISTIEKLQTLKIPFVLVGRYFKNLSCDYVVTDDNEGGFLSTQYLIQKGHKKIS
jgi:LacI family transcriptional regulator